MIGYGVLAGLYFLYAQDSGSESNSALVEINKRLDEVDDCLDQGMGIIAIADKFERESRIPAVLTIRHILFTIFEASKEDVLPYTHVLDRKAPSDVGPMPLLDSLLSDFKECGTADINDRVSALDEFKNILYLKEDVLFEIEVDGNKPRKGFGVLVLTMHELLFIPIKWEFLKNIKREKLFEFLHKATKSMPFLNVGLATTELLMAFSEGVSSEERYLNAERKSEMVENYVNNDGWSIPYKDMTDFTFPYRMKGFRRIDHSLTIKTGRGRYKLFQAENASEFAIELLEQLLVSSLLHQQVYYPVNEKYQGNLVKCNLVPHAEIDYEDPRMIEFRNNEMNA
ncbi:hypothetical protein [Microbulbifer sediminum]|uniref:hypothetical protein n=1 Tax=Microbulbifer sediminum TaxID=2904250 RepID=UPI001F341961|nr:hypothetical protein [Microbulbifer sediminum]